MKDKAFFDTNILVYLHSEDEPEKRNIARNLLPDNEPIITIQVVKEFVNTLRKKYHIDWSKIKNVVDEISIEKTICYLPCCSALRSDSSPFPLGRAGDGLVCPTTHHLLLLPRKWRYRHPAHHYRY